ncbi:MAG: hypothetical protein AAF550_14720 [Myxococcota bacterium]
MRPVEEPRYAITLITMAVVFAVLWLNTGCSGSASSISASSISRGATNDPVIANEGTSTSHPDVSGDSATHVLRRSILDPILEAGLGNFLRGVATEPHLEGDRFVGFRLISLYPEDPRFTDVALQPGDTIVRVNGRSIERPEQALQAWEGLRVASELVVEYLREEERLVARWRITDSD